MGLGMKRTKQRVFLLLAFVLASAYFFAFSPSSQIVIAQGREAFTTTADRLQSYATSAKNGNNVQTGEQPAAKAKSPEQAAPAAAAEAVVAPAAKSPAHVYDDVQMGQASMVVQRQNFTVTVVLAKEADADIDWVKQDLPGVPFMIYNIEPAHGPPPAPIQPVGPGKSATNKQQHPARDTKLPALTISRRNTPPSSPPSPPQDAKENLIRGVDVVAYLTYIVDHYDSLPDIVVFARGAQRKPQHWDIIGEDLPATLKRLNGLLVWEEGFVNLYCDPRNNCPRWRRNQRKFANDNELRDYQIFNAAWNSLNPGIPFPKEVGQPGGNQFAVTGGRIRYAKTRAEWAQYRDWVVDRAQDLSADQSSRVWEYMWPYVFRNRGMICRKAASCYCDTYGVCLGGDEAAEDIARKKDGQVRLIERYHAARARGADSKEWANSIDRLRREIFLLMRKGSVHTDKWISIVGSKPLDVEEDKERPAKGSSKGGKKKSGKS
ncbi:hypothetical protein Micbo1qcDRAFT_3059 [Microdochium bolleyi]|uniref:Uncharacterized protein n=1 Tax=Microdochium bolleyi TaxID=196109 RepID=A0A136JI10_9PEZI|nr:hypothetical protein Micbo1qcDRAFT_3059 [Microdochium bolleyi]